MQLVDELEGQLPKAVTGDFWYPTLQHAKDGIHPLMASRFLSGRLLKHRPNDPQVVGLELVDGPKEPELFVVWLALARDRLELGQALAVEPWRLRAASPARRPRENSLAAFGAGPRPEESPGLR